VWLCVDTILREALSVWRWCGGDRRQPRARRLKRRRRARKGARCGICCDTSYSRSCMSSFRIPIGPTHRRPFGPAPRRPRASIVNPVRWAWRCRVHPRVHGPTVLVATSSHRKRSPKTSQATSTTVRRAIPLPSSVRRNNLLETPPSENVLRQTWTGPYSRALFD